MGQTISVRFALLAVVIAVGGVPCAVWSAEPKPEPATRWDYHVVTKEQLLELGTKNLVAGLNKLGDDGWELAAVDGATYLFKRPRQSPRQIEDVKRRVLQAQADVDAWKDRVAWSERMVKKGYLTERHLQEEEALLQAAEVTLEKARKDLQALTAEPKPDR